MKNLMFLLCFFTLASFSSLHAQQPLAANETVKAVKVVHTPTNVPAIKWEQTTFEFGEIPQGTPAEATFTLTNTSDAPLLLKEVKPTCGCTVANYTQDPILPGESTEIKAKYNAKSVGNFQKTIKVFTNQSDAFIPLKLKGKVVVAE